jgi:GntR family transcriptional repressor for pyruvate dehydrogenase complex
MSTMTDSRATDNPSDTESGVVAQATDASEPAGSRPATFLGQPVRVTRAYEELASIIRRRIVSGDLSVGDRIPSESMLAKEAQVSRSTVREALRTLEEAGLIARASPKIMIVSSADDDRAVRDLEGALRSRNVSFKHLHEALLMLEPELTRLAAIRGEAADVAELEANLARQAESLHDFAAWSVLDQEFHLTIARMSGNPALVLIGAPISDLLAPLLSVFMVSTGLTQRALDFHHRILEEIQVRDADAAALMARKHVNDLRAIWEQAGLEVELEIEAARDGVLLAVAGWQPA